MQIGRDRRRALASWFFVGALFALCGVLGVLQYRWIGAVAVADRERLQDSLQASLNRLSQDLNSEIGAACRAVLPVNGRAPDAESAETAMIARYEQWRAAARHGPIFQQIAIAESAKGQLILRTLDPAGSAFRTEKWPENWAWLRARVEKMEQGLAGPGGPQSFDSSPDNEGTVFELPLLTTARPVPFARREIAWSIFELNLPYLRDVLLPELVQRYVAAGGSLEYQVEVMTRTSTPIVIYRAGGGDTAQVMANSDASVSLFGNPFDLVMGRGASMDGRGTSGGPGFGRWQMYVRHRAGSLEAVVAQARLRSVGVTSCVLLLMFGTLVAWIRFTRRSQRLAELQMDFVAGVSHELRTPLSVIHTAAYNLKGGVASDPAHVERYGALIHQESGRLKQMVEQVLRFSKAQAGHIVQEPGPVWIESVIADTLEAGGAAIQIRPLHSGAACRERAAVDPGRPGGARACAGQPHQQCGEVRGCGRRLDWAVRRTRGGARADLGGGPCGGSRAGHSARRAGAPVRSVFPRPARTGEPGARHRPGTQPGQEDRGSARRYGFGEERTGQRRRIHRAHSGGAPGKRT